MVIVGENSAPSIWVKKWNVCYCYATKFYSTNFYQLEIWHFSGCFHIYYFILFSQHTYEVGFFFFLLRREGRWRSRGRMRGRGWGEREMKRTRKRKKQGERGKKVQFPYPSTSWEVPVYLFLPLSHPFLHAQVPAGQLNCWCCPHSRIYFTPLGFQTCQNTSLPSFCFYSSALAFPDHALSTREARTLPEYQGSWHTRGTILPQVGNHFTFVFVAFLTRGIMDIL